MTVIGIGYFLSRKIKSAMEVQKTQIERTNKYLDHVNSCLDQLYDMLKDLINEKN